MFSQEKKSLSHTFYSYWVFKQGIEGKPRACSSIQTDFEQKIQDTPSNELYAKPKYMMRRQNLWYCGAKRMIWQWFLI